jgi:hypothetical protein
VATRASIELPYVLLKLASSCFFSSFLEGKEVFSTFETRTAFAIIWINHLVSYTGFLSHNLPKPIKCNIGSLRFVKQPQVQPQKKKKLVHAFSDKRIVDP